MQILSCTQIKAGREYERFTYTTSTNNLSEIAKEFNDTAIHFPLCVCDYSANQSPVPKHFGRVLGKFPPPNYFLALQA